MKFFSIYTYFPCTLSHIIDVQKTELHSQTRFFLRHIYLHVQCKRIKFRSVGYNYMHTQKQNDNYKRWKRRKKNPYNIGSMHVISRRAGIPSQSDKVAGYSQFLLYWTTLTYPRMQNDTEAISCEPLEEGDDSCVAGTDHFKDRPPSEGTSLTAANPVNVKYDLLDSSFWNIRECVYEGFSGFRLIFGM